MNNLKPGNVVKYLNEDGDSKLAVVTGRVSEEIYSGISFNGRNVYLGDVTPITNLCARTLDEYLGLHNIRTIIVKRDCEANLDNQPLHEGLKQGTILTGVFRCEGHVKNHEYSTCCIEIDTPNGTVAIPEDAFV